MTDAPEYLTKQDVAAARGVEVATISRYLGVAYRLARHGVPPQPTDIPLPDGPKVRWRGVVRPTWLPGGPIREWIALGRNPHTTDQTEA